MCALSRVWLFATPWTVAHQAPLSLELSRQEHGNGLLFSTPEDLPNLGIEPASPASPALAGGFFTTVPLGTPLKSAFYCHHEQVIPNVSIKTLLSETRQFLNNCCSSSWVLITYTQTYNLSILLKKFSFNKCHTPHRSYWENSSLLSWPLQWTIGAEPPRLCAHPKSQNLCRRNGLCRYNRGSCDETILDYWRKGTLNPMASTFIGDT